MLMEGTVMVGKIFHCANVNSWVEEFTVVIVLRTFLLMAADVPCADNSGCSHSCGVIDGMEQCFCPTGFVLNRFDSQACIGMFFLNYGGSG